MNDALPLARVSAGRTAAACVMAFVLPGLGHLVLGRWVRAVILGLTIMSMVALGFLMEGHWYKPAPGEWLTWFFSFLDLGVGLPYLAGYAANFGFEVTDVQAAKITYEYGNTFLSVAGALNMLAALDAFDIAVGRKP
jgi:hypothetical protein